jgi:serine/threonine-protein kinase
MLAGELPFNATSVVAILMKHAIEDVPALARLRPDSPEPLVRAIERCLAKQPGERWESAAALRAALMGEAAGPIIIPGAEARPAPAPAGAASAHVATPAPIGQFRTAVVLAAGLATVGIILDITTTGVSVTPYALALAAFIAAAAYGRLRFEGYGWPDLLGKPGTATAVAEEKRSGEHVLAVQRVHTDRAAVIGMLVRLSNAERAALEDVLPAADRLLSRATELARQLETLDRKLREIEPELRGEVASRRAAMERDQDGTGPAGRDIVRGRRAPGVRVMARERG